jgi:hypothetical protein
MYGTRLPYRLQYRTRERCDLNVADLHALVSVAL